MFSSPANSGGWCKIFQVPTKIGALLFICSLFLILPSSAEIMQMEVDPQNNLVIAENNIFRIEIDYVTDGVTYANFTSKTFTGDIDFAIGYNSDEINSIKSISLDHPYVVYLPDTTESKTLYYVTGFTPRTIEPLDYGNEYNLNQYIVQHSVFDGYDNETNESIWTPTESALAYDSQTNDGVNYTANWHTEHSKIEQWLDLGQFGIIERDYDDKDTWKITQNRYIEAGNSYRLRIVGDIPIRLGELNYKYDFALKPSSETLGVSIISGHLYVVDPWFSTDWNAKYFITYNQSAVIGTQNHFPSQYYFTGLSGLNENGSDIRITYENGTQSPREIEFCNSTTGNGSIFLLANLSDTGFWFYYNNSDATEPANDSVYGSEAVWSEPGTKMVFQFNDEPTTPQADSSAESHTLTYTGSMDASDLIDGNYGKEIDLDGNNDHMTAAYSSDFEMGGGDFTIIIDINFKPDASLSNIIQLEHHAVGQVFLELTHLADNTLQFNLYTGAGYVIQIDTAAVSDNVDHSIIVTRSGTTWTIFVDGVSAGTAEYAGTTFPTGDALWVGVYYDAAAAAYWLDANYGFMQIIKGYGHDVDYALTHYNNMINPTSTGINSFYNSTGNIQHYTDSLLYNSTSNYNHTIESDGTITANRSIVAADDTNDTAQSIGTSYLTITHYNNSQTIVRNFTFTGDNLDWYNITGVSPNTTYHMMNSNGTSISNGSTGSTTYLNLTGLNLSTGTYYIDSVTTVTPTATPTATATPSPTSGYDGGGQNMNANDSTFPTILLGNSSSARILLGISDWVTELKQQITDLVGEQGQGRPKSSYALWSLLSVFGLVLIMDGSTFLFDKNRTKTTFKLNAVVLIIFGTIISLSGLIWTGYLPFEKLNIIWFLLSLFSLVMILDGSTFLIDKKRTKTTLQLNATLEIILGLILSLSGLLLSGCIAIT